MINNVKRYGLLELELELYGTVKTVKVILHILENREIHALCTGTHVELSGYSTSTYHVNRFY